MSRAAAQAVDLIASPTPERIHKGDNELSGKRKAARARVLDVVEKMDSDCRLVAAHILALRRLGGQVDAELWRVVEYRIIFSESEQDVGMRLGLSRGQVSRRFISGLQAIGRVLRGRQ